MPASVSTPPPASAATLAQQISAIRQQLTQQRSQLVAAFAAATAGVQGPLANKAAETLVKAMAVSTDAALKAVLKHLPLPRGVALAAVGGYGRGELFPYSDVDVLILLPRELTPEHHAHDQERISAFLTTLWDLGLDIGSSVRTVEQCIEEGDKDITVQTSLLETRLIAGSATLFRRLRDTMHAQLDPQAFFRAKLVEMHQRHVKHAETAYSLEPNCKESPGGLRDIQVILWLARAAGMGGTPTELVRNKVLTADEAKHFKRHYGFLRRMRCHLHLAAKRREDRIVFDLQTPLAQRLNYHATDTKRASEMLMQRYYLAAKGVSQLNTIIVQTIESILFPPGDDSVRQLDHDFRSVQQRLDVIADDAFERNPSLILKAFLLLMQHSDLNGFTPRTMRAVWHNRTRIDAKFRRAPANKALFMQMLQQPDGILHEFRRMNELSVLGRYLPVFRRIVGQMQHDLFHVYTVDQHILQVLRNVRRFTKAEHAHEYPLCSQLMANFDKPWLLYIAALYHDIAKGRGGDHSQLGAVEVRKFCRDHGIDKADTGLVTFLVEHHLTMSSIAQKQDLSDPDVIAAFAVKVPNERYLSALYILTVADIRGTSPKVWNAWKGKLLEDLYRATLRMLGGERPDKNSVLQQRQEQALSLLRLRGFRDDAHEALWKELDVGYFLRNDPRDIAWATRHLWNKTDATNAIVRAQPAPVGTGLHLLVYCADQPDLFARIVNYFDERGLNVHDARVHTTRKGYALDTFVVMTTARTQTDDLRALMTMVENELAQHLDERHVIPEPERGRGSRQARFFPMVPQVHLAPDDKGQRYVLSITAPDRSGLLHSIAHVFAQHHITLESAKIMTLGERAEDTFLISGASLAKNREQMQFENDLLQALS